MRQFMLASLVAIMPAFSAVEVKQGSDQVEVFIDGQPFTTMYYGDATMKPFLSPLRAPSGKIVSRRGPMEVVEGETKDHPHHQGLFFTHNMVNGNNFWESVRPGRESGRIVVDKVTTAKGGKNTGEIAFEGRWVGKDGKTVLKESRRMVFHSGPNRIIDLDITLTPADEAVTFGDTKEGTFALRLADKLAEKGGSGTMTNAQGAQKMKNVWGKPSEWVDYSGTLDGEALGVAIFDHPQNPKHPTTWHARDYGLFAANPFGDHDFYNDNTKNGSITVQPGKNLRFRYRVVIHPGDTASAKIGELYKSWANSKPRS